MKKLEQRLKEGLERISLTDSTTEEEIEFLKDLTKLSFYGTPESTKLHKTYWRAYTRLLNIDKENSDYKTLI